MRIEEEELAEWRRKSGEKSVSEWIREQCNPSRVVEVEEVGEPEKRVSLLDGLKLPVLGEAEKVAEAGRQACRHNILKGYHCWQCGGVAKIGGKDD